MIERVRSRAFRPALALGAAAALALLGGACTEDNGMTPERAQATVTAFVFQNTATAEARVAADKEQATATAQVQVSATAGAGSTATGRAQAAGSATVVAGATAAAAQTAAAAATQTAQPTATRTAVPTRTPTPGPRYNAAVGGQGEVQISNGSASFGFGVGRRGDGKLEGWLQYGSGRGTLRATQFTKLDTYQGTAGFWGLGALPDIEDPVSFNVNVVSGGSDGTLGSFRVTVFQQNGRPLLSEGGAVLRGSINVSGP